MRLVFTVVLGYLGSRKFVPDTFKVIFQCFCGILPFQDKTLQSALQLVKLCFNMALLDFKDAYYLVAIAGLCSWVSYISLMLPQNGLACALRLFTKLMKPVYAVLRRVQFCCCRHQFINNITRVCNS